MQPWLSFIFWLRVLQSALARVQVSRRVSVALHEEFGTLRAQVVNATTAKPAAPPPRGADCLKTAVPWFREFTFACALDPVFGAQLSWADGALRVRAGAFPLPASAVWTKVTEELRRCWSQI